MYIYIISKTSGVHSGTLSLLHGAVEAYLDRLASTKQVSDVRKIIRGPSPLILPIFGGACVYLNTFACCPSHFHDSEVMQKTRNAIWSRSV